MQKLLTFFSKNVFAILQDRNFNVTLTDNFFYVLNTGSTLFANVGYIQIQQNYRVTTCIYANQITTPLYFDLVALPDVH